MWASRSCANAPDGQQLPTRRATTREYARGIANRLTFISASGQECDEITAGLQGALSSALDRRQVNNPPGVLASPVPAILRRPIEMARAGHPAGAILVASTYTDGPLRAVPDGRRGVDREPGHQPADVQETPDANQPVHRFGSGPDAVDACRSSVHTPRADGDDQWRAWPVRRKPPGSYRSPGSGKTAQLSPLVAGESQPSCGSR
jgi:hypothetical protein